jgi:hypothetical protein
MADEGFGPAIRPTIAARRSRSWHREKPPDAVLGVAVWLVLRPLIGLAQSAILWLLFAATTGGVYGKNALERRAPVLVTNEVALEAASQGEKSEVKDRLQLTSLRHGVLTADQLWDLLAPPGR